MFTMAYTVRIILFATVIYHTSENHIANGGRVLFITSPTGNHIGNAVRIARELRENHGHHSSMITSKKMALHPLLKNSNVDIIVSEGFGKVNVEAIGKKFIASTLGDTSTTSSYTFFSSVKLYLQFCDNVMEDETLLFHLQKRQFDIAVIDIPLHFTCMSILPYNLSIPFIKLQRILFPISERIPQAPSATPAIMLLPFSDEMSFSQRFINTFLHGLLLIAPDIVTPYNVVAKYAPYRPFITNEELNSRAELILIDQDAVLDYQMPLYQNQILIGGITAIPARPLTGRIGDFMTAATNGAVILSFGSIFNNMTGNVFNVFVDTFQKFPDLKFVFKTEALCEDVENIMTLPWLSQNDILGHKHTKLLITHCGGNSIFEALYHGVPLLGIPICGDGFANAIKLQSKGYGVILQPKNITIHSLEWAIREVLENPVYKKNVVKASAIIKSRPDTSSGRAAYWIDHVMVHGGDHLRPKSSVLPYYQYMLLDVLSAMVLMIVIIFYVCRCCGKYIHRHACGAYVKQKHE